MPHGAAAPSRPYQGGVEVFTSGSVDLAASAMTALLDACVLQNTEAATSINEVHNKGDDRSKEECIGYSLKDMPEQVQQDGTSRPRAQQGKYCAHRQVRTRSYSQSTPALCVRRAVCMCVAVARPKVFYWRGNISNERAEECIMEYRKQNQYTGGPNFHKTGFAYGNGAGNKERNMIVLRNLMTWPITHARRNGWLELADSFLKIGRAHV